MTERRGILALAEELALPEPVLEPLERAAETLPEDLPLRELAGPETAEAAWETVKASVPIWRQDDGMAHLAAALGGACHTREVYRESGLPEDVFLPPWAALPGFCGRRGRLPESGPLTGGSGPGGRPAGGCSGWERWSLRTCRRAPASSGRRRLTWPRAERSVRPAGCWSDGKAYKEAVAILLVIKTPEELDIPQLLAIYRESSLENCPKSYPAETVAASLEQYEAGYAAFMREAFFAKPGRFWMVETADGLWASSLRLLPLEKPHTWMIGALETHPDYRLQGHAARLLADTIQYLEKKPPVLGSATLRLCKPICAAVSFERRRPGQRRAGPPAAIARWPTALPRATGPPVPARPAPDCPA